VREALAHCPYTAMITGSRPLSVDEPTAFAGIIAIEGCAGAELATETIGALQAYLATGAPFIIAAADQGILAAAMEAVAALSAPVGGNA
jgi:hypothetical protein